MATEQKKPEAAKEVVAAKETVVAVEEQPKSKHTLTGAQKFGYGVGAVGKDLVYGLSASYVMFFYQDVMGISAAFVGLIMLIARVFDAANDPLMGVLVGKTKTRWGRFRPWLFTGTVLNSFVLFAMYAAPDLPGSDPGLMIYFSVTYILWGLTYTFMDIPFWAMIPAVTRTPEARENLSVIGRTCAGIGGAIITSITMMAVPALGGYTGTGVISKTMYMEGFKWFALIIAIVFIVFETITCIMFKENANSKVEMETSSVKDMFKALFKNDQAIVIVVSIVLFYLAWFVATQLFIYFFKYDVGGADWNVLYTTFATTGVVAQIIGMMLIYPLLRKKFSNTQIFTLVIIISVIGYGVMLVLGLMRLTHSMVFVLYICGALVYIGNGMLGVLCTLFLANSVDYGQLKTGQREESMIFSMQTFVVKAGSGFASFICGVGIDAIGIVQGTGDEVLPQSASTIFGLDMIMCVPPIICLILSFIWFKAKFKLTDERSREILAELKATGQLDD